MISYCKTIFVTALVFITGNVCYGATLHSVLVGDTIDEGIGAIRDIAVMRNQTLTISKRTGLDIREYAYYDEFDDEPYDIDEVLNGLNTMNVGRDDVVIFQYSGHGYRTEQKDSQSQWPIIFFSENYEGLRLDTIIDIIEEKRPRLALIITDCCNNYIPQDFTLPERSLTAKGMKPYHNDNDIDYKYKQLFLYSSGMIVAAASEVGEHSWGDSCNGGVFTKAFFYSLKEAVSSPWIPDWNSIMENTYHTVQEIFAQYNLEHPENPIYQNPIYTVIMKPGVEQPIS